VADRAPLPVPEARRRGDSAPVLALSVLVAAMALVGLAQGRQGTAAPAKRPVVEPVIESPGAIALREGGKIDVNRATAADLELLPRVGPAIAGRIIEARPFASVEDLRRVRGIGPRTLEQLRPLVEVTALRSEGDESAPSLAPTRMDGYQAPSPGASSDRRGAFR